MITNAILQVLANIFNFCVSLLPNFTFIQNINNAKEEFISFISGFMQYTLYIYNVPVLKASLHLLLLYITFLSVEYIIKLMVKYITNVV